jgi:hypothetical protein
VLGRAEKTGRKNGPKKRAEKTGQPELRDFLEKTGLKKRAEKTGQPELRDFLGKGVV